MVQLNFGQPVAAVIDPRTGKQLVPPGSGPLVGEQPVSEPDAPTAPPQMTREEILQELANTPEFLGESATGFVDEAAVQAELLGLSLDDLNQGFAATPQQIALIEEAGTAAFNRGSTDIERAETLGFRNLREELAPGLGLRPSDTPIVDRGGVIAAEALRQRGNLSETIRGGEALARLNFPLQASGQLQQGVLGQQGFGLALQNFQEQLRQQAFQNRANIFGTQGQLGLGLATGSSSGGLNFPRGTTTSEGAGFGEIAGGAGALIGGIAAISSRDVKTDNASIDEDAVLEKLEELPVEAWRYKPETGLDDRQHIGAYAEDFREAFGLGDGETLNMIDTTGVLMAAVKSLSKKVKRLENG